MRLAAPEDVLATIGIQQSTGSLATAGAALDATYPLVEAMLESRLVRERRLDTFDLPAANIKNPEFRLFSGLVTTDETIVVNANGEAVAADDYEIQLDIGIVRLIGEFAASKSAVTVEYSCGLEVDPSATNVFQEVPEAIKQAAIAKACAYLLLSPANSAKEKAKSLVGYSIQGFELRARQMLAPYTRPRGGYLWEALTQVVAE